MIKVDIVNEVSRLAEITKVKAEVGRRCRVRGDASVDDARRAHRAARFWRVSSEAAQARHRSQSSDRKEVKIPPGRTIRFKPGKDLQNIGGTAGVNPDSTPFPQPPPLVEPRYDDPTVLPWAPPPRPKFQHRYTRHLIFFALTFFTTTFAPAFEYVFASIGTDVPALAGFTWEMFRAGLWYSIPLLIILGAHEFGHYFACRYHDVDATLPYFLPAPLPLTGTFGAVIRNSRSVSLAQSAVRHRRGRTDWRVCHARAFPRVRHHALAASFPMPHGGDMLWLGEPLLLKGLMRLQFGNLGDDFTIVLHPVGQAAWWGMLATAAEPDALRPTRRRPPRLCRARASRLVDLDGQPSPRRWCSRSTSSSWVSVTVMMLVMSVFLGFRHPRVRDEITPIGAQPLDRLRARVGDFRAVLHAGAVGDSE
jgi:hypothetical protein